MRKGIALSRGKSTVRHLRVPGDYPGSIFQKRGGDEVRNEFLEISGAGAKKVVNWRYNVRKEIKSFLGWLRMAV